MRWGWRTVSRHAGTGRGVGAPSLKPRFQQNYQTGLLDCLTRLGRDVEIVMKAAVRNRDTGHLTVHFA